MSAVVSRAGLSTLLALLASAWAWGAGPEAGKTGQQYFDDSLGGIIRAPAPQTPVARGRLVFSQWCAGCHAPDDGSQAADVPLPLRTALGTYKLRQRYGNTRPAALEERTDLTVPLITAYVRRGANLMPPFRKTEINDAELRDLIAYLTSKRAAARRAP